MNDITLSLLRFSKTSIINQLLAKKYKQSITESTKTKLNPIYIHKLLRFRPFNQENNSKFEFLTGDDVLPNCCSQKI